MTRPRTGLGAIALVTLLCAGCSSGAADNGGTATPSSQAVRFAECMRDNGVSEFPDPDGSGRLTLDGVVNGSQLNPDGAAWKQAIAACKDLQPPGFAGNGKRTPQKQKAALAFARCIREHGVKDFPDPAEGQPLVDTRRIPSSDQPGGMDILNAAMRTCGALIQDQLDRP